MIWRRRASALVLNWEFWECARVRRVVLNNVPSHRARSHGQRGCQIHLAWPAASGEVPVLRADHDLIGTRGYSRSRVDACAATRLDHVRARLLEDFEVTLAPRILARFLRAELDPELDIL